MCTNKDYKMVNSMVPYDGQDDMSPGFVPLLGCRLLSLLLESNA